MQGLGHMRRTSINNKIFFFKKPAKASKLNEKKMKRKKKMVASPERVQILAIAEIVKIDSSARGPSVESNTGT